MVLIRPQLAWRAFAATGVAILALALSACSGANPTSSPSTSTAGAEPSVSPAPTLARPTPRPVPTWPPPAHRPQTIHVLEDPLAFHDVPVAGCTSTAGCVGDQLNGSSTMLDAATHAKVGTFAVRCVLMDPSQNLYHCPANVITLTGRGQITFDETVAIGGRWTPAPWPITAGAGEFLGATGSVTSPEDSTWPYGDFVITITG